MFGIFSQKIKSKGNGNPRFLIYGRFSMKKIFFCGNTVTFYLKMQNYRKILQKKKEKQAYIEGQRVTFMGHKLVDEQDPVGISDRFDG